MEQRTNELMELKIVPILFVASIYASLGEKDLAFECLESGYRERSPVLNHLKADPRLENLRSDPRFADLLRRIGLSD